MPIKNKSLLLFLFLLVIEFISILYLTLGHRMPLGHDTFYVFGLQYYCLNHTAMYGEIPQWIPYLTHGTSTPWFFIVQGCLTMAINIFSLLGPLLKHMNFLPLFYTGIFVDKVVLLAGVWLLSSRYFSSSLTRFFVASCVMGSCICMTQMGYNMHLYSGIPLTLYLLHMFLDTSRWRYLFLGANLFFVQTIVDCTYFIPVVSLTIFLYFLIDWLHDPSHWIKKIKKLSFGTPAILCAAGILFSALYVAWLLIIAKEPQIISADLGRHANWSTPLNVFLTYGGNTDFRKWLELFCRVSPAMDYTLYMGFIPLALVPIGLFFNPHPRKKQLVLLILVLLLFSMATPLSTFFYYVWPTMKFYRHIGLIAPLIKLFICFLSGYGFEIIFDKFKTQRSQRFISWLSITAGIFYVGIFFYNCQLYRQLNTLVSSIIRSLPELSFARNPQLLTEHLNDALLYSALAALIFFIRPFVNIKKKGTAFLIILLFIHITDIYSYYFSEIKLRSFRMNQQQYEALQFEPLPYQKDRNVDSWEATPKLSFLETSLSENILYGPITAFLLIDPLTTSYRTDNWQESLNDFVNAYRQYSPNIVWDTHYYYPWHVRFPKDHTGALKIAGVSEDKIQFFRQAYSADDITIAKNIASPDYSGNIVFLSGLPRFSSLQPIPWNGQQPLSASDRLHLSYTMKQFTANRVEIAIDNRQGLAQWLLYSDVWHPHWRATVNEKEVTVWKGDLGYKAVPVDKGENKIQFTFDIPYFALLQKILAFNSLGWLILLPFLMARSFKKDQEEGRVEL